MQDFKIIRDNPAFGDSYSSKEDKFKHKVYADTLTNIIKQNKAPLIIGLLGDWGSGKSTILNIFKKSISNEYKTVYFNSWKYSKDSFRRQFLLETAKELISSKVEQEVFIKGLNTRFLKELKRDFESYKDIIDYFYKVSKKIFLWLAIFGTIILILTIFAFIYGLSIKNGFVMVGSVLGLVAVSTFPFKILENIMPDIFKIDSDPQLILPEQFEDEFAGLIKKTDKEIVFIIDDIDRCPSQMIIEILDSARTFFASGRLSEAEDRKCYFILAMDDKAVTDVLVKEKGERYKSEEILKFVDVSVKLTQLSSADLVEFSRETARATKIPEGAIQIGIYGGFDTPRKIKHFLNGFKVLYLIAKQREEEGIFNYKVDEIVDNLAKILVLQIAFYNDFKRLKEDPKLLVKWDSLAHDMFQEGNSKQKDDDNEDPALLRFLWTTRDTTILDLESILHLKIPEYAVLLPNYSEFKNAVLNGQIAEIKELSKSVKSELSENIVSLVQDILDNKKPTELFLKNILDSSLEIYNSVSFDKRNKEVLGSLLIRHLLSYKRILDFNPMIVLGLFDSSNVSKDFKKLLQLCREDIRRKPNSAHVSSFINLLSEKKITERTPTTVQNINSILSDMAKTESKWVVDVLREIKIQEGIEWKDVKNKIPSHEVIATNLLPLINDKETEIDLYNLIISVSFKFWNDLFITILGEKCLQLSQRFLTSRQNKLDVLMRMVLMIIKDAPDWIKATTDTLVGILNNIFDQLSEIDERGDVLEAVAITSSSSSNQSGLMQTVIQRLSSLDERQLEKILKLVVEYEQVEWWKGLKTGVVNNVVSATEANPATNLLKFKLIYPNQHYAIALPQIQSILNKVLASESFLNSWKEYIGSITEPGELQSWLISTIKDSIKKNIPNSHRGVLLDLLIVIVNSKGGEQSKVDVGNYIFDLINYVQDQNISSIGRSHLNNAEGLMGTTPFKIKLNTNINEISKKGLPEVISFKNVLSDFLSYKQYIEEETRKNCVELIISLVASNENAKILIAKELLTLIEKIPQDKVERIENTIDILSDAALKESFRVLIDEKK